MARVILVNFNDNESAQSFVDLMDEGQNPPFKGNKNVGQIIQEMGLILMSGGKIEAMVARPTIPCRCTSGMGVRGMGKDGGYTKTIKFGWWVHAKCKRPSVLICRNFIKNMIISAGRDLLSGYREDRDGVPEEAPGSGSSGSGLGPAGIPGDDVRNAEGDGGVDRTTPVRDLPVGPDIERPADPVAEDPQGASSSDA